MRTMANLKETVEQAKNKLNTILDTEHDFPNLAGHIYLQRLFEESPLVFRQLVLKHNLLGKVYTPDVAVGIRYYHHWANRFLSEENRPLIMGFEDILNGKPISELKDESTKKETMERVQQRVLDYLHKRHNFFARMSKSHTNLKREDINSILPRVLIVITDSERILGIGDQGSGGSLISTGKLNCYFLGDGMFPGYALPIGIDVGTNNMAKRDDPHYDGIKQPRLKDEEYYPFVQTVLDAIADLQPGVVQFEDFKGERAWRVLDWFYKDHPEIFAFNDDSQGTGSVVIAGLLAAERVLPGIADRLRAVFDGAGGAATGIAQQVEHFLRTKGMSQEDARKRIIFSDSADVLYRNRTVKTKKGRKEFMYFQEPYILNGERAKSLEEAAKQSIPDWKPGDKIPMEFAAKHFSCNLLIGTSTVPGQFHPSLVKDLHTTLTEKGEDPTVLEFPLSNPTAKAEILTVEESEDFSKSFDDLDHREDILKGAVLRHLEAADGKLYLGTGSPFPGVVYNGKQFEVGQCNNVFIFPGIGLALDYINANNLMSEEQKRKIDMIEVLYDGARGLATMLDEDMLSKKRLYPYGGQLEDAITSVATTIITDLAKAQVTKEDIARFRWTDSEKPDTMEFEDDIPNRAADFSLDPIREDLLHFRALEKR